MRYCKKCIMPDTRPETVFNEEGICDACVSAEKKHAAIGGIDWKKREKEFVEILDRYRSDGSWYDCVIPVSGGKNSCFQAYVMKYKYGMHPLCVNFVPCAVTDVGQKNLLFLRDMGFDLVQIAADRKTYREMVRVGYFKLGDCCWPEHIGIFTAPFRVAYQYKVPLIIYGENSQFEYGGPAADRTSNVLNRRWLEQFAMMGYRLSDLVRNEGFDENSLKAFKYPTDEELKEVGVTSLFLGYYMKWDNHEQYLTLKDLGFHVNPGGPVEGQYLDYENLDCKFIGGLHEYLKYVKYGYGRSTDQMCFEIRHGRMTRPEAVRLVSQYEGKVPWKYVPEFLEYLNITKEEFVATLDRFTNKKIFLCDDNGKLVKDKDGNLVRRYPVV